MVVESSRRARGGVPVVVLAFAVLLLPFVLSVGVYVFGPEEPALEDFLAPAEEPEKGCVRETTFMRYHHYEFLKDLRDDVLRDGKRGGIRLQDCRQCHHPRAEFCDRCHEAVNLTPDCWNCHDYR